VLPERFSVISRQSDSEISRTRRNPLLKLTSRANATPFVVNVHQGIQSGRHLLADRETDSSCKYRVRPFWRVSPDGLGCNQLHPFSTSSRKAVTACLISTCNQGLHAVHHLGSCLRQNIQTVPSSFSLRSQQPCVSQWNTASTSGQSKLPATTVFVTEVASS